jgi:hypothetical protein
MRIHLRACAQQPLRDGAAAEASNMRLVGFNIFTAEARISLS